jgi:hypothetical protein
MKYALVFCWLASTGPHGSCQAVTREEAHRWIILGHWLRCGHVLLARGATEDLAPTVENG